MLLRVCYIDVPGFLTLAWRDDTGRCERLMKSAFKKSFHLRRNGHTGEQPLVVVVGVDRQGIVMLVIVYNNKRTTPCD